MAPNPVSICTRLPLFLALSHITLNSTTIYSTPAHLAVASASVGFNVFNSATLSSWNCVGTGYDLWDWFRGEIQYNCTTVAAQPGMLQGAPLDKGDGEEEQPLVMAPMSSSLDFRYTGASELVHMNTTWSCFNLQTHAS
jgi:hypothetical protein